MDMVWWQILILVGAIVAGVVIALYFFGKRNEKKAAEAQEQIEAASQQISMLVIDKRKMKIKDSGLPQMVYDEMPKLVRWRRFPIVKAKVGPRIMTFISEPKVFEVIPIKKEIKATISGLYITGVKATRGSLELSKKQKKKKKKDESKLEQLLKKGRGEL